MGVPSSQNSYGHPRPVMGESSVFKDNVQESIKDLGIRFSGVALTPKLVGWIQGSVGFCDMTTRHFQPEPQPWTCFRQNLGINLGTEITVL
jgi:hypothetical protein